MRGKRSRRTWRIIGRRQDGSALAYREREDFTRAAALENSARLEVGAMISHDFWWAMHSLSYEPQSRPAHPSYDGALAKPSRRRFWG